ncbi:septation ring formation regulator EzrA, partial [Staphylococcus epidermidis]|uniref:septation ring formation regulator EzrA n=1 Tax=Staphylococcus epidermidis TaxID=1282 RepID=UPI0037D9F637
NYHHQLTQLDHIINLHKQNQPFYQNSKLHYPQIKRHLLPNPHQFPQPPQPLQNQIQNYHPNLNQYHNLKTQPNYLQPHNHIAPLQHQIKNLKSYI